MKLRLVREDGSDARIEDLMVVNIVEIDGVETALQAASGPSGEAEAWSEVTDVGRIEFTLEYPNERRSVTDLARSRPGQTFVKYEFDCPFARRRREREVKAKAAPASRLRHPKRSR